MNCEPLTLLPTDGAFPFSKSFDYGQYIDSEQELWRRFRRSSESALFSFRLALVPFCMPRSMTTKQRSRTTRHMF
jgi:hypothetical protein